MTHENHINLLKTGNKLRDFVVTGGGATGWGSVVACPSLPQRTAFGLWIDLSVFLNGKAKNIFHFSFGETPESPVFVEREREREREN
jgi:hypothetical protein